MRLRTRSLPRGWYPGSREQTVSAVEGMARSLPAPETHGCAGIAPHAGWEFSGSLALQVLSCISTGMDTIVIIGGHLASADGIMCCLEDAFETPLGPIPADSELVQALSRTLDVTPDVEADNTVEIQLPLLKYVAPRAHIVALRAPPSPKAQRLGECIAQAADRLGRTVAVLGSTDLTHYGHSYGFAPRGEGAEALRWVREVNDRRFIEAAIAMDIAAVLERSRNERSACSAGGAVAAISFARARGATAGQLLHYCTSHDIHPSESFVGYAGILYS
jgi:AmmeMemoRadiSam system protein B